MDNIQALLLTVLVGLFFLIGFGLVFFVKRKKELVIFSTGMAFIIMLGMVFFDLVPEIIEMSLMMNNDPWFKWLYIGCFIGAGMLILKLFDLFLPHHHHEHQEKEDEREHNRHLYHIGFITVFSLILHNILEGMSIYIIGVESLTTGLITSIAVGCHNIPLGIEIASNMFKTKKHFFVEYLMLFLLVLSSSFGALGLFFFGALPGSVMIALTSLACGMIIYIALFELLHEVFNNHREKLVYLGMITGFLLITVITFLE